MEENIKWSKKKKIIIYSIISIFVLGIGASIIIYSIINDDNKKVNNETKAVIEENTSIETQMETQEETQIQTEETTTVVYESEAVNNFTTSAGSEQDSFYKNSLFVGDSVMYGFERYLKARPGILSDPFFFTNGSYAARVELQPVTSETAHPWYQNKHLHLTEVLPLINPEKVFLFFGLNDIGMVGVDKTVENYGAVISNIKEIAPDVEIFIISTTYMAAGSELKTLNNANIKLLNQKLEENSTSWGVKYIDIAKYMYDKNGCLVAKYSSDGYVHITESAYDLWLGVLRDFASKN